MKTTAEYNTGHSIVKTKRGTPKFCEECGTTDKKRVYDWANMSGKYKDPNDYRRMCRSCHNTFDAKRRNEARNRRIIDLYSLGLPLEDIGKDVGLKVNGGLTYMLRRLRKYGMLSDKTRIRTKGDITATRDRILELRNSGYTYKETAKIMGIHESTVGRYIKRS